MNAIRCSAMGTPQCPGASRPAASLAFFPIFWFRSGPRRCRGPARMPRRRPRRADPPLPPGLIPPDFVTRHDLWRRLYLDPLTCLTPRHGWFPLTDAEWAALAPHLQATGCGLREAGAPGRPIADPRARLDAIFR